MEIETGKRLREIRCSLGMSQRQLAAAAKVANATISQIESGTMNPTVSMLKKILSGIPISMSDFFADEFEIEERIFFSADDLVDIGEGGISYRQVGSNLRNKAIQLLHEVYQPGTTTGKHSITHEGEECGLILKGKLEVTVGDKKKVLLPGDAYYFKSTLPHHFKNVGREACELISACTPPGF